MGCTRYWIMHLVSLSIVTYRVSKFWSCSSLDKAKFLHLCLSLGDKKGFLWSKINGQKNGKVCASKKATIHSKRGVKLLSPSAGVLRRRATSLLKTLHLVFYSRNGQLRLPQPQLGAFYKVLGLFISPSSSVHKDEKT